MVVLDSFRVLGKHLLGIFAGIYVALAFAGLVGWIWPPARLPVFIIGASFLGLSGISVMIHELRKGKLSTGIIVFDSLPILLIGIGGVLLIGEVVGRYWTDGKWLINFLGIYFWVLIVSGTTKFVVQDRKLEEDLQTSPDYLRVKHQGESSSADFIHQSSDETAPRPSFLKVIGSFVLAVIAITLGFLLLYLFHG